MVGRTHRFHGYGSLRGVYQRGKNVRGSLLTLRYARREGGRPYRVAVVVSRKVNKSAVVRNRIRRQIYEIVRRSDSDIASGTDLVFTVYNDQIAEVPSASLEVAIDELLLKATPSTLKT